MSNKYNYVNFGNFEQTFCGLKKKSADAKFSLSGANLTMRNVLSKAYSNKTKSVFYI